MTYRATTFFETGFYDLLVRCRIMIRRLGFFDLRSTLEAL